MKIPEFLAPMPWIIIGALVTIIISLTGELALLEAACINNGIIVPESTP